MSHRATVKLCTRVPRAGNAKPLPTRSEALTAAYKGSPGDVNRMLYHGWYEWRR